MNYWPGTKIVKSQGNAFTNWKDSRPSVVNNKSLKQSLVGQKNAAHSKKNQFTIYSRAKPS